MAEILITRPSDMAQETASLVRAQGHVPHIAPMLKIEPVQRPDLPADPSVYDGLVFTSPRAVKLYRKHHSTLSLPVYTIGRCTAAAARDCGFCEIYSAGNDGTALGQLMLNRGLSSQHHFLHPGGFNRAGKLEAYFQTHHGPKLDHRVLYTATPSKILPKHVLKQLEKRPFDFILFFSARTAEIFVKLCGEAHDDIRFSSTCAVCLSPRVAEVLSKSKSAGEWRDLKVASAANQSALLSLIPS